MPKLPGNLSLNWVRLGIGFLLLAFSSTFPGSPIDSDRIIFTLLLCFSLLIIGLAFEKGEKA